MSRALGGAYRVYLFADYGGTLVPHVDGPEAVPTDELLKRLEQLSQVESFSVYILSGKSVDELDGILGLADVGLIGLSGFEIRKPGGETSHPVDVGVTGRLLPNIEL